MDMERETSMTTDKDREETFGLPTHYDDGDLVDDIRDKKHGTYGSEFDLDYPVACARVRQYCARVRQEAKAEALKEAAERLIVAHEAEQITSTTHSRIQSRHGPDRREVAQLIAFGQLVAGDYADSTLRFQFGRDEWAKIEKRFGDLYDVCHEQEVQDLRDIIADLIAFSGDALKSDEQLGYVELQTDRETVMKARMVLGWTAGS